MTKPKFDRNTPFNDLPPLPPSAEIDNDSDILKKLVSASRALASVNINVMRLPNPYMLVNTIVLQEAKTSTEIENIFTTEDELYKAVSDNKSEEKADLAVKEVLLYREALWAGYHAMKETKILNLQLVLSIFRQIKNTTSGIRPPQANVVIKRGQSELHPGEVIYTPPRGTDFVERLTDRSQTRRLPLSNGIEISLDHVFQPWVRSTEGHEGHGGHRAARRGRRNPPSFLPSGGASLIFATRLRQVLRQDEGGAEKMEA